MEKDRKKGFAYLKKAADMGDVSACYFLGFSHHRGLFENDNPNAQVPIRGNQLYSGEWA